MLARLLEHALDPRHIDHIERECASAECIDTLGAVSLAQSKETIRLTHLDPWQRSSEQLLGVDADVLAEGTRPSDQ